MKSVHTRSLQASNNLFNKIVSEKLLLVKESFEEEDILTIQDTLLTPGLYIWQVDDLLVARAGLKMFLTAISIYNNIAMYSDDNDVLYDETINIKHDLERMNVCQNEEIEDYFVENFYADFMWIEKDEKQDAKIDTILRILENNNFHKSIPIIILAKE